MIGLLLPLCYAMRSVCLRQQPSRSSSLVTPESGRTPRSASKRDAKARAEEDKESKVSLVSGSADDEMGEMEL